ncbi:phage tail protein [Aerococcus sp. 1KP-2016]|uniref:phage tail tube protein n=1 Tax=Aerococcus sp. 1KP-2016 TaxID=1981982 RepID=UPI000B99A172|nr:phage tail protein [Aerococcus sp. 1KP-2016]OYQ68266.1 phage tail protein [Aerococcus sp. 1KP-2016]
MAKAQNVTYGKPKVGGAISVASLGTALPTDAIGALDASFKNLGYISEDGLTNADTRESESLKAWGGDVVLTSQTEKSDTFTFTLIEALNIDVLKFYYGEGNVTGTLETGITINANSKELKPVSLVVDMLFQNALKRIVIPQAKITETGEIVYNDTEAVGYETTVQAFNDDNGNSHIEYVQKPSGE